MPRQPRFCPPRLPQHVIQRGNNRQVCFNADEDMAAYAHWLFRHHLDEAALTDIRESANGGLAFGSERFKDEIEANLNRRVRRLPAGRRPKGVEDRKGKRQGEMLF